MRLTRLPCLLGLLCAVGPAPVLAAPLVWQEDPAPPITTGAAGAADRPALQPRSPGRLSWTLDPDPDPEATATATATPTPTAASVSPGTPAASATQQPPARSAQPSPASPDALQPDGLPPYGLAVDAPFPPPYIGGGVPSAYIGGWGNYWFGLSGGTPGKLRDGSVDASFNTGIGFGDFYKTLALQVDWGVGSIKNLGANGGFSVSAGRLLIDQPRFQLAAAGGVLSFYTYGTEGNQEPASGYGVISMATPLRPGNYSFAQVLQLSFGAGGYQFAYLEPETFASDNIGYFAALGLEITRNVGLSLGWSNRGANVNLSYTPFRDLPIYLNVVGADIFNTSPSGAVAVFSISWGDDFRTALF